MILPLYKPVGWTSFDVVKKVRSITGERKVGHGGTLDPFAEGVLVLGLGKDTKRLSTVIQSEKTYVATLQLGTETTTLDPEGEIIAEKPVPDLTEETIHSCLASFVGEQEQTPPMFSAKKVDGVPLYKLARKQITVAREPVKITIKAMTYIAYENHQLTFEVTCSKGTYIRVLGKDIAQVLGTVGHLIALKRTRVGQYRIEDAITMEMLAEQWMSIAS
ncbi:MAG: tRNA pseudouridine(55) synthase TruB [Fidelibacterota bacterium]